MLSGQAKKLLREINFKNRFIRKFMAPYKWFKNISEDDYEFWKLVNFRRDN